MHQIEKINRIYPNKPEWKIILDHLVHTDNSTMYRICRKMIIQLQRLRVPEIYFLIEELNPSDESTETIQNYGPNWPKSKGNPFVPNEIILVVFDIADKYIPDDEITFLITSWLKREILGNLSKVIEKRHVPLIEVVDAVKKYFSLGGSKDFTSEEERAGVRVSMIYRFLSENLTYINIAKHFVTLYDISKILDRIVGPAFGSGKVGGKSAGMILAERILLNKKKTNHLLDKVYTPKSWFIASDGLLDFIYYNALDEFIFTKYQSTESIKLEYPFLEYTFKNSKFPPEAISSFNMILEELKDKPLVVRSSSLLEDSFEASFTGKYKSLFISNNGTKEERLSALMNAVTEVYASTFGPDPIEYRKQKGLIDFHEEMGILVQEVVGSKCGKYYMPSFAGVAMSNNEFRWSNRIKREDGVVRLVAGLGTRAVDRTMNDYPVLLAPGKPGIRVHQTANDLRRYSQNYVDVINLETNQFETISFDELIKETKGNIKGIEKIVSFIRQNTVVEPLSTMHDFTEEEMVITFNSLVTKSDFVTQIKTILDELSSSYDGPVDIEFASDGNKLYLLQCRPQSKFDTEREINIPSDVQDKDKIFSAREFVSNGKLTNIDFVVYIDSKAYSELNSAEEMYLIANFVSKLNQMLPRRKFILIGPGRWGSKGDIKLGVPIIYSDINNTSMLIEYAREKEGYLPELSFGTHFFQDLVEANIYYLPLYPDKIEDEIIFNNDFFLNSENSISSFIPEAENYKNVIKLINIEHFKANSELNIYMDGDAGQALAFVKKKNPIKTRH